MISDILTLILHLKSYLSSLAQHIGGAPCVCMLGLHSVLQITFSNATGEIQARG